MSVVVVDSGDTRFVGLSTDDKPTACSPGSTFHEVDTNYTYICLDGTNWTRYERVFSLEQDVILNTHFKAGVLF